MNALLINTAIVSFLSALIGGFISIKRKSIQHASWAHYIDMFCDSMFVAIALGHLLPELYHHNPLNYFLILLVIVLLSAVMIHHTLQKKHSQYFIIGIFFLHCYIEGFVVSIVDNHHLQATLSIAILAHKILEPFVFFNLLSKLKLSQKMPYTLLILFASLTPLGILSGQYANGLPHGLSELINALTCGTFLGISADCYFKHSCHDHHHNQQKWLTLLFVIIAFAITYSFGTCHHH